MIRPGTAPTATKAADQYHQRMTQDALGDFRAMSDIAGCLLPLLRALRWKGSPRDIAEALPYFANDLDLGGLRNTLAILGFSSRPHRLRLSDIDPRLAPCLFLPDAGGAMVVTAIHPDGHIDSYDGAARREIPIDHPEMSGVAYMFSPVDEVPTGAGWFRTVIDRFRGLFWQAFIVTLLLNVVSLATPLFVMSVYDKVVTANSMTMLVSFTLGVAMALIIDTGLRAIRARILAFVGARLDNILGNNILQHLLSLPPGFTERATVGAQIARLKDFESVREFFTGPLATTAMDLPFAVLYFLLIFLLGGVVALVPVLGMVGFIILGWLVMPLVRKNVGIAAQASARRQELLVETLGKMRAIKQCGGDAVLLERYRDLSARAAFNNFHGGMYTQIISVVGNILIVGSGMVAIATGVLGVIDGSMTMGNLIAVMMLVWRVLTPLQTAISLLPRIETVRRSILQIDGLMALRPERQTTAKTSVSPMRNVRGHVVFTNVSLRYDNEADPALVGVSFEVQPGEVVAITGRNGSGKSTVLKLLQRLYSAQAGSIRIDNTDVRQIDPVQLRHAIAYVPQTCSLFFGPISQNLRLVHPTATDAELRRACEMAGVWDEVASLPKGIDTRIGDGGTDHLAASFIQKLSLARAYLKRSPIMLFDEPVNGLDFEGDRLFMEAVERFRGQSTIFMVTHRPSHLKIADRILVFEAGRLRLAGPADEVRAKLPQDSI